MLYTLWQGELYHTVRTVNCTYSYVRYRKSMTMTMTKQFKFKFNDLTYLHSNSNNNTVRMDMDYGDIQYINTVYEYLDTRVPAGTAVTAVQQW